MTIGGRLIEHTVELLIAESLVKKLWLKKMTLGGGEVLSSLQPARPPYIHHQPASLESMIVIDIN
jgi:hypothetical protein